MSAIFPALHKYDRCLTGLLSCHREYCHHFTILKVKMRINVFYSAAIESTLPSFPIAPEISPFLDAIHSSLVFGGDLGLFGGCLDDVVTETAAAL